MQRVMYSTGVAVVLCVASASLLAQQKPAARAAAQAQLTTEVVTTKDGRRVLLRSDKTWEYDQGQSSQKQGAAVISAQVALIYNSGDIKPVPRVTFYLQQESLLDIAKQTADYKDKPPVLITSDCSFTQDHWQFRRFGELWTVQQKLAVASATTDFEGKFRMPPTSPGTYFLVGYTVAGIGRNTRCVVWNYKLELQQDEVTVLLDQNNAMVY